MDSEKELPNFSPLIRNRSLKMANLGNKSMLINLSLCYRRGLPCVVACGSAEDCKSLDFGLRWFESNRPQIHSRSLFLKVVSLPNVLQWDASGTALFNTSSFLLPLKTRILVSYFFAGDFFVYCPMSVPFSSIRFLSN